jgi:hypothetical protein
MGSAGIVTNGLSDDARRRAPNAGRLFRVLSALVLTCALVGCAYQGSSLVEVHYQKYKARMPEGDRVFVCSSYGCRTQTPFRFTAADIAEVKKIMAKGAATPAAERDSAKVAVGWMGSRADKAVGTSNDRPGDDLAGNGDPGQMDCVDVATNLTSYMLIMERNKLFRHHTVGSIYVKEDIRRGWDGWTHYAGILIDNKSKQKFAVDGWLLASGKPPEIVEVERWYIDDSDLLFGAKGGTVASMKPTTTAGN